MNHIIIFGGLFDLDEKAKKLNLLEKEYNNPEFWNDRKQAEEKIKEINHLKEIINPVLIIKDNIEFLSLYDDFSLKEENNNLSDQYQQIYEETLKLLKEQETVAFLGEEFDDKNAIFEIHAGAGGTESQDWAQMLLRMYLRYFDKKGFKYELIDEQPGEEVGIKSVSYIVKGSYAYGYLKSEKGVHRLVRLSPFDANNRRHTSFAAVEVIPEFDNDIDINIDDSDIRVDVYRSSGAGGQGVNTTDSAVRITHIPTGIVVTCQNERSQIKNKEIALQVLRSKLYALKQKENQDKINSIKSSNSNIEFGSQIRSYVLHPYSMVKDHRTGYETSNVDKVLNGYIDEFVDSYLRKENKNGMA